MQRNPAHGLQGNKMGHPLAGSSVLSRQAARFVPRNPVLCLVLLMKSLSRDLALMLSTTEIPIVPIYPLHPFFRIALSPIPLLIAALKVIYC